ncbi:MAG: ABC transporter permease [Bacteroidetes bacterium]|nr:MAG: ABC transporter permease [Bacteroidota bacterium]
MNRLRQLFPIIRKEVRQILRDRKVLAILTLVPALLLLLNGYALNFDVRNITLAVYDGDRTAASREFVGSFVTAGYFEYTGSLPDYRETRSVIDDGTVKLVLAVPPGFADDLLAGRTATVQLLVDGVDANAATTTLGYAQAIVQQYSQQVVMKNLLRLGRSIEMPVDLRLRMWYNPELKSAKFLIPGLIAFILAITGVIATALSIVKEKERNTIEQIDVSPVHPLQLIVGKMVPYAVISLLAAAIVLVTAYILFDVTVKGSLVLLFGVTLLFICAALGQGLLVSTLADNQQVAFQLATVTSMLPTLILSGFMFPVRSMPLFLQILSNVTPAKFYLVMMRGIVLKGTGVGAFWEQALYLSLFTAVVLTVSVVRFRRRKEAA